MSFTIPSFLTAIEDPTGVWPQAEVDPVDWDIWGRGLSGGGVVSGCAVTQSSPTGMKVNVASGRVVVLGIPVDVLAQTNVVIAAAGAQPRFDLVTINAAGVATITTGSTAVSSPAFPALPAGNAPLAAVYIPANLTNVLNAHIVDKRISVPVPGSPAFTKVNKTLDESRQSTTAVANDAELFFPLAASTKYSIRGQIVCSGPTTADLKFGLGGPTSPTVVAVASIALNFSAVVEPTYFNAFATTTSVQTSAAPSWSFITLDGIVQNGSNAGTFAFQWAQNASVASNTTVYAGSFLEWDAI